MNPRMLVAGYLTATLPTWRIEATDADIVPSGPTALVYRTNVKPGRSQGLRDSTVSIVILSAKQIAAADQLDGLLDDLLVQLDAHPAIGWTEAEYATYAGTHQCYRITTTVTTQED